LKKPPNVQGKHGIKQRFCQKVGLGTPFWKRPRNMTQAFLKISHISRPRRVLDSADPLRQVCRSSGLLLTLASAAALLPQAGRAAVPAPTNLLAAAPAPRATMAVTMPPAMAMAALHLDQVLRGWTLSSRPRLGWQGESRRGERHKENPKSQFAQSKSSPIVASIASEPSVWMQIEALLR
jgi:hypothetical protein